MDKFSYISLGSIYDCERKALSNAALQGDGDSFMRGIIHMVRKIEQKIQEDSAEKEATNRDKDAD